MSVTMYGTHCSHCNVMEMKLKKAGIPYDYVDDLETVVSMGRANNISSMPIVVADGRVMDFTEAMKWVSER